MIGTDEPARSSRHRSRPDAPGQHQVEDDQIDRSAARRLAHLATVTGAGRPVAVLAQEAGDQLADLAVIIDDKNVRFGLQAVY